MRTLPDGRDWCLCSGGRAESFPSDEQGHVRWCVWGVCELSMTLGSLYADGWVCVPVSFVVWCEATSTGRCWPLGDAWSWIQ